MSKKTVTTGVYRKIGGRQYPAGTVFVFGREDNLHAGIITRATYKQHYVTASEPEETPKEVESNGMD